MPEVHGPVRHGAPDRRGFFLLRRCRPLRLRALTHHERDSDKYHAVCAMLNDLLKLADHYLAWRRRTRPVSMTQRKELEHRAHSCEKKLHHCYGTGQYLGALCHSCNIAAQTPKTIPVHFLLRDIATIGSPVSRAPREELGEDSDNEGAESEAEGSGPCAWPKPRQRSHPRARPTC